MGLIIGEDDFGEIIKEKLNFIDKSLFIKEIFDKKDVKIPVIVRPRRFGKTLNMSMLHHFLAPEVNLMKTEGMFDGLKIAQAGSEYMQHQGKYPVIFVSFKSMSYERYDKTRASFAKLISQLYGQHYNLLSSTILRSHEKAAFERILNQEASDADLTASLLDLSGYLHRHYKVKPWLLIDEYDTPIQSGYFHGYYNEIIALMRGVFGSALKGNTSLHRAVITGILRVSKESLFSGVNNLDVFSVLSPEYASCFGFTQAEVDEALKKNHLESLPDEIKRWYNGYRIGDEQIYNPWSLANCMNKNGLMRSYWVNTSSNDLIREVMAKASASIKEQFEQLLENKPIEAVVSDNLVFGDLQTDSNALWSLLVFSGYLTAVKKDLIEGKFHCLLQTPNHEVAILYKDVIQNWFAGPLTDNVYHALLSDLTEGRVEDFFDTLKTFLWESASYFDTTQKQPEKFYHGFVMGLIVSLAKTHQVQSNKESGRGRYDVLLIPFDKTKLGVILEFKATKPGLDLQADAEEALLQIDQKAYATALQQQGIQNILKIGLAFRGKDVAMVSDR